MNMLTLTVQISVIAGCIFMFSAGCKARPESSHVTSESYVNPAQEVAPFVVSKSSFSPEIMRLRDKFCTSSNQEFSDNSGSCPKTKALIIDTFTSIVDRAGLQVWFKAEAEPSFEIGVQCESSIRSRISPHTCGNKLYLTTGFMLGLKSDDELAAVVAHEMSHYLMSHDEAIVQKFLLGTDGTDKTVSPKIASRIARQKRVHEYDADDLSVILLHASKYDPNATLNALVNVKAQ
ncbi:MAG: M48 family metalloprotease, partial [Proteobacteria bacterium]|nr:M48 family metalloprotease [Pseudomonadota bacterium]